MWNSTYVRCEKNKPNQQGKNDIFETSKENITEQEFENNYNVTVKKYNVHDQLEKKYDVL